MFVCALIIERLSVLLALDQKMIIKLLFDVILFIGMTKQSRSITSG